MNILDAIGRLCNRTERDLAVAGALVGSVSAMAKLFPAIEHYSRLTVDFYGRYSYSWDCVTTDGTPPREPWRDFLRWFHGRPQSECFVVNHRNGAHCFRRSDIRGYTISNGERERAPTSTTEQQK